MANLGLSLRWSRAEFYGLHWYVMEILLGQKVDGWDAKHAYLRYRTNPDAPEWAQHKAVSVLWEEEERT